MSVPENPAMGDEDLASEFLGQLGRVQGSDIPESVVFFWAQAQSSSRTGLSYTSDEALELFERIKDLNNG